MILEVAILDVKPSRVNEFETAFQTASSIIASMPGYISHELQRCLETTNRYILLVRWHSLEDHTIGFRQSPEYQQWRSLLHHLATNLRRDNRRKKQKGIGDLFASKNHEQRKGWFASNSY
jgi:heme-degrading monooxygenase HmoA